jgi:hypothetical protein
MFSGNPINYSDVPLINNGFWPDLNLKDFQEQRAIPPDLDAGTVGQALVSAVTEVNAGLASVEEKHRAAGYVTAASVPGVTLGSLTACARNTLKRCLPVPKRTCWASLPPSGGVKPIRGRKARKPAPGCWLSLL